MTEFKLKPAKVTAEVGYNHNGDMKLAKEMIWAAKESGADFVKFQSWRAKKLTHEKSEHERLAPVELSDENHFELVEECKKAGVEFLTTCFDLDRVDFLAILGLKYIKVASSEATSWKMINLLKEKFDHLIISTGVTYDSEVEKLASLLKGKKFTLLHCLFIYPAPMELVNLARMDWLRNFTDSVGFSDHTVGTVAAKIAIARGANLIEKHFTIDRNLPGKDQKVSAEPAELAEICKAAKTYWKYIGTEHPEMTEQELKNRERYIGRWGDNR